MGLILGDFWSLLGDLLAITSGHTVDSNAIAQLAFSFQDSFCSTVKNQNFNTPKPKK
jgi:hypothetical protein